MVYRLVLIRHGESEWNKQNRFTGWADVGLTQRGRQQAQRAGNILAARSYSFDMCFTSVLSRAISTLDLVLERMGLFWLPEQKHWRLNERHYGALQGLNKAEIAALHGGRQVQVWRRGYATPPPPMACDDPRHPCHDPRYALLDPQVIPGAESLETTLQRVLPFWHDHIAPAIRGGRQVLVVAHGNSLRALVKYLDSMGEQEVTGLEIPVGVPLVYELGHDLRPLRHEYLAETVAIDPGKAVALAGAPGPLSGLAQLLAGAGICEPQQLQLLEVQRSVTAGGGPELGAVRMPEGVRYVPEVEQLVENAELVFLALAPPCREPEHGVLMKQLAPNQPGAAAGRLLVLLAEVDDDASSASAKHAEAYLQELVARAGVHQQPGARVLGLLLQHSKPLGGAVGMPQSTVAASAAVPGAEGVSAGGWHNVTGGALLHLADASEHDVHTMRSLLEAASGVPVQLTGVAGAAEAPAGMV